MNKKCILLTTLLLSGFSNSFSNDGLRGAFSLKEDRYNTIAQAIALGTPTAFSQTPLFQHPITKWGITLWLAAMVTVSFVEEGASVLAVDLMSGVIPPLVSLHAGHKKICSINKTDIKVWHAATAASALYFGRMLYKLS